MSLPRGLVVKVVRYQMCQHEISQLPTRNPAPQKVGFLFMAVLTSVLMAVQKTPNNPIKYSSNVLMALTSIRQSL